MKRPVSQLVGQKVLLLLAGSLLGCATVPAKGAAGSGPLVGQPMPELALRDVVGTKELSLKSLAGQVVLLDIWASWCGPCKEELPLLDELAGRLKGSGVEIVAVSIDEDPEAMNEFLRLKKSWNLRIAHDPRKMVPDQLRPPRMPSSYVVDRGGVLQKIHEGFSREDVAVIEQELKALAKP